MPIYNSKSHEELRWRDYAMGRGEQDATSLPGISSRFTNFQPKISVSSPASPSIAPPSSTTSRFTEIFFSTMSSRSSTTCNSSTPRITPFTTSSTSSLPFAPKIPTFPANPFTLQAPSLNASKSATSIFQPNILSQTTGSGSLGVWSSTSTHQVPSFSPFTSTSPISSARVSSAFLQPSIITSPVIESPCNQTTVSLTPVQSSVTQSLSTEPGTVQTTTSFSFPLWPLQSDKTPEHSSSAVNDSRTASNLTQPSLPRLLASPDKAVDTIIPIRDPFGTPPATQPPSCPPNSISSFQCGISSMQVSDKSASPRTSSLLTARHSSLRRMTMHARKYHPRSDGPKEPFFRHAEEKHSPSRPYSHPSPRVNPRSVFFSPTVLTPSASAAQNDSSPSTSSRSTLPDDNPSKHSSNKAERDVDVTNIMTLIPRLKRDDYYTEPIILDLAMIEMNEPGFCSRVKDFVVGRHGYGSIKFYGETDIRSLDLNSLVLFNDREVTVYKDETQKPPVGQGLNKAAEVTLLNVKCIDKNTGRRYFSGSAVERYQERLRKAAEAQGAEFVSFDPVEGMWRFRVKHFSSYVLMDED